jgi:hypothetical protein
MRVLIVEAEPSTHSGGPPGGTNEQHVAVALLRALIDPFATLEEVVSAASDIDLAVTAPNGWNDRVEAANAVRTRLGNDCGVLVSPRVLRRLSVRIDPKFEDARGLSIRKLRCIQHAHSRHVTSR